MNQHLDRNKSMFNNWSILHFPQFIERLAQKLFHIDSIFSYFTSTKTKPKKEKDSTNTVNYQIK